MNTEKLYIPPEDVESFTVLYQILDHAARHYPEKTAYRQLEGKAGEASLNFAELRRRVDCLRAALIERGFSGKHIAVCGETSYEWIIAYLAVMSGVGICIPLDKENTVETLVNQLDYADTDAVFCSAKCLRKLKNVLPECKSCKTLYVMRTEELPEIEGCDCVDSMQHLIEEGAAALAEKGDSALPATIDPDETSVIIYTSGTTGANKGVMLSNRNIMGTLRGCARLLHFPDTSISVLPINHSYELHAHIMSCMYCGTTVCLNDDLKRLLKNLARFAPEMSCMVPMMLDLIVRKLKKQIADQGKEKSFKRAVMLSNALRKIGIDKRRTLFRQVLEPLGGNLQMIICGGAALSQSTADFLDDIGIRVYNGYGITECSPVAAVNPSKKVRRFSVGHLLPTMQARIANPNEDGNGEIQLYGDNVMKGYYKAPQDTEQVFTKDGWFRTGDIGHIDKDKFLFISGRLKNLIILPNGKNVSPEDVEDALQKHIPYIKESVVYADEELGGICALIHPDPDFCREHNLNDVEQIKAFMQDDINSFNAEVPSFKRLMDYQISQSEFVKNTTHKIQRFKIAEINKKKEEQANV